MRKPLLPRPLGGQDQCIEVILVLTKKLEALPMALDAKNMQMELIESGAEERVNRVEGRQCV